jgi:hypothetical protein
MEILLETERGALLLLQSIEAALARGAAHYDKCGRRLTTPTEVIEALVRDGEIDVCETALRRQDG